MKREEIERLAQLARIELTDAETDALVADMQGIIAFVDAIKEADVPVGEENAPDALRNVMREDGEPHEPGIHTDALLEAAPRSERGFVKVKKIL